MIFRLLKTTSIFLILFFISLVIRFPFFFNDVIDWDESIFILMGQSIANGYLPYEQVWDLKPPLGYYFFSLPQILDPKNIALIRFFGTFTISISSILVFFIARKISSSFFSMFSSILFILLTSAWINSGQAVMMEHLALPFILGSLLLLVNNYNRKYFFSAILLGFAILIRTNLAFIPLALFAIISFDGVKFPNFKNLCKFIIFLILPTLFFFALYAYNHYLDIFYTTLIKVPIKYTQSGDTPLQIIIDFYPAINKAILIWLTGLLGIIYLIFSAIPTTAFKILFLSYFSATTLSIFISGYSWPHYLIQIAPYICIAGLFFVESIHKIKFLRPYFYAFLLSLTFIFIFYRFDSLSVHLSNYTQSYYRIYKDLRNNNQLYIGPNFEIAEYINSIQRVSDTILVTDSSEILLYYLTNRVPLIPSASFPNFILNSSLIDTLTGDKNSNELMRELLAKNPTRIIIHKSYVINSTGYCSNAIFKEILSKNYILEKKISDRYIYKINTGKL
jgi:hypothetical protein